MAAAIGPCMLVAPLVFVVALLLIPLWPVAIVVVGALWLVVWPIDWLLALAGVRAAGGASRRISRWLRVVATPWVLFEAPRRVSAPRAAGQDRPPDSTTE